MDGRDDETTEVGTTRDADIARNVQDRQDRQDLMAVSEERSEDDGHRPGGAGEQPVAEEAPGSLGGDNGGA